MRARENQAACRSRPASPCFLHVRRDRSGSRRNPHYIRAAGRVVGRDRVAPAVSRHHGQRAGAGVRARHSVLAAFAATPAQAVAPEASRRALNKRSGPPAAIGSGRSDLTPIGGTRAPRSDHGEADAAARGGVPVDPPSMQQMAAEHADPCQSQDRALIHACRAAS